MLDYASAQWPTKDGYRERYVLSQGAPLERAVRAPVEHMQMTSSGVVRFYQASAQLLRVLSRAIYFFPVLIIAKIVLFLMSNPIGDLITVAFVLLVVTFFAVFALTVLLFAIVGPKAQREARSHVAFAEPRAADLDRIIADAQVSVRISGKIDAGLEHGAPVIVEQWARGERLVRHFEGRSFALIVDGKPHCVVELAASPVIVTHYENTNAESAALEIAGRLEGRTQPRGPVGRCVLRQGDVVEVLAREATRTPRIEDERLRALVENTGDDAGPYRAADASTLLVRCTMESPVVIISLP
jgi:hypothetical protein